MNNGVIYYNRGFSCIPRLLVSLNSLRQKSNIPITLFLEGDNLSKLAEDIQNKLNINIIYDKNPNSTTYVRAVEICMKSPYDNTIWMDADTTIHSNFDNLFEEIPYYDIVISNFAGWKSSGSGIAKRIQRFSNHLDQKIINDAINYGPAINCGFYGFRKNMAFLEHWLAISKIGEKNKIFIPDEVACQILLPQYKTKILDPSYNVSVKYGSNIQDPKIIHYHGRKHCRNAPLSYIWIKEFIQLSRQNFCNINQYVGNDRTFQKFLTNKYGHSNMVKECMSILNIPNNLKNAQQNSIESETTVVTACDPKYVKCLEETLPTWIKYKNILKFPMIVYINGFKDNDPRLDFLRYHSNIRLIHWDMHNVSSHREKMLSSFIFGPARDVTTRYWLKIDCDAYATDYRPILKEEMKKYDIVGHKWGYTKPFEWINTLNKWSDDKKLNFTYPIDTKQLKKHRYYHSRTNSFVQLHSTEFIKKAAEIAGDRLPIPSQDTYLWYISCVLNKSVWRYNFKRNAGIFNKRTPEQIKSALCKHSSCQSSIDDNKIKVNIGSGRRKYRNWINADKTTLDITKEDSWVNNNFTPNSIHIILAEHILDKLLDPDDIKKTLLNFSTFIHSNGHIRIAVPDGYHPSDSYIKVVSKNNRLLYNYKTLEQLFEPFGLQATPLEYFDENGQFHFKEWDIKDGYIKRSSRYDKRNKNKKLSYTSLIVDFKPNNLTN